MGVLDSEDGIPPTARKLLAHPASGDLLIGSNEGLFVVGQATNRKAQRPDHRGNAIREKETARSTKEVEKERSPQASGRSKAWARSSSKKGCRPFCPIADRALRSGRERHSEAGPRFSLPARLDPRRSEIALAEEGRALRGRVHRDHGAPIPPIRSGNHRDGRCQAVPHQRDLRPLGR